ncbi:MAG: hypothetical protein ACTSRZ_00085 [Promethearchaeota archaeon]
MSHAGKTQCPYCKKWYKNLKAHIKRMHPDEAPVDVGGSSKSTDALEKELAKKLLSKKKVGEKELTVEDVLKEEGKGKSKKERDKEREEKKKKLKKQKRKVLRKIEVDYWITDLHDAEIGIYQKERFMAKNRQFSRNLELVGAVKEEGKPDGMFGYMTDSWDDIPLKDMAKRRLVIKWFNSESVAWLGTIEEMVINSMRSSVGANDILPAFKVLIPRYKYVIDLTKEHTKFPKVGEIYTFPLKDEKSDQWHIFTFDEDRFTVGSDWSVLHGDDELIARIDEKVMNIGGKFVIEIYEGPWAKMKNLYNVIVLFAMMLKFNREIQKKLEKLRDYVESGKVKLTISASEEKFMMNPRALRR